MKFDIQLEFADHFLIENHSEIHFYKNDVKQKFLATSHILGEAKFLGIPQEIASPIFTIFGVVYIQTNSGIWNNSGSAHSALPIKYARKLHQRRII